MDENEGMKLKSQSDMALYLWDYFYLREMPTPNEEKPWRRIECATLRIRESEPYLTESYPPALRLKNAKRVRRAVREILKLIPELESIPESWTAEVLAFFEVTSDSIIERLRGADLAQGIH